MRMAYFQMFFANIRYRISCIPSKYARRIYLCSKKELKEPANVVKNMIRIYIRTKSTEIPRKTISKSFYYYFCNKII